MYCEDQVSLCAFEYWTIDSYLWIHDWPRSEPRSHKSYWYQDWLLLVVPWSIGDDSLRATNFEKCKLELVLSEVSNVKVPKGKVSMLCRTVSFTKSQISCSLPVLSWLDLTLWSDDTSCPVILSLVLPGLATRFLSTSSTSIKAAEQNQLGLCRWIHLFGSFSIPTSSSTGGGSIGHFEPLPVEVSFLCRVRCFGGTYYAVLQTHCVLLQVVVPTSIQMSGCCLVMVPILAWCFEIAWRRSWKCLLADVPLLIPDFSLKLFDPRVRCWSNLHILSASGWRFDESKQYQYVNMQVGPLRCWNMEIVCAGYTDDCDGWNVECDMWYLGVQWWKRTVVELKCKSNRTGLCMEQSMRESTDPNRFAEQARPRGSHVSMWPLRPKEDTLASIVCSYPLCQGQGGPWVSEWILNG